MKIFNYIFILCLLVTTNHAATFDVTNGNDSGPGSLRQAVLDANANSGPDIIDILTTTTFIQIDLTTKISMFSEDNLPSFSDVTINGNNVGIFGQTDSRMASIGSNVIINNVNFFQFGRSAIGVSPGAGQVVTLNNCVFGLCVNNSTVFPRGGAILHFNGELNLNNCLFYFCQAEEGGALASRFSVDQTNIHACTFQSNNNATLNNGEAIWLENLATLNLSGTCNFETNQDIYRKPEEAGLLPATVNILPSFNMVSGSVLIIN